MSVCKVVRKGGRESEKLASDNKRNSNILYLWIAWQVMSYLPLVK